MRLEMHGQMRLEQRMRLAPHMIQSMEILQLPILALQERIEQELNGNPVLEADESAAGPEPVSAEPAPEGEDGEKDLVAGSAPAAEDFGRSERLDDDYVEYMDLAAPLRAHISRDEPDRKLEALKNTAAAPQSLHDYLTEQWRFIDADEPTKIAGQTIIDYIDERGYLSVRLEQLHNKDKGEFNIEQLQKALQLVQKLEPAGVGARDLKECLLIQMAQDSEYTDFERRIVAEHMGALLDNRLPDIARKMSCTIERLNRAIEHMSKLDTSPGLQIGQARNQVIAADVIVEPADEGDGYKVRLADSDLPRLKLSAYYTRMAESPSTGEKARKFLRDNIRSGRWVIDAIEQRKNTLLKVTKSIVKYQRDFFDKGQLYLKPLPMSKVADDVGVHIATVSRAVAGKYVRCPAGILPLRKFFSGGTSDEAGNPHSWEAIRAKLQGIIDSEDKGKPLNDEQIRQKLGEAGISNIARRTVAKYRKLLDIPPARFRKKY